MSGRMHTSWRRQNFVTVLETIHVFFAFPAFFLCFHMQAFATHVHIVLLLSFIISCTKQEGEKPVNLVTFPLRGEVTSIDTSRLRITIAHEEIPDYMAAMTMPFKVKDKALLRGIEPGDSVSATLAVSRTESWLEGLVYVGVGTPPATLSAGDVLMSRLFQPGETLPDVPLRNQDGELTTIGSFRGKVLAITFIYTRCPIPEFCIRMTDHFFRIQQSLKNDSSLVDRWHLLTISFDPKFDTPGAMKSYARNYGADTRVWSFLTDSDSSGSGILKLATGLDLLYEADEGSTISHNLRTVLVDAEGKIVEVIRDNEWKPEQIAARIKSLCR
jgi:protein SCO1/2